MSEPSRNISHCIKLDSNESPFGASPRAIEAMRRAAEKSNIYPDNSARELREKLAGIHRVGFDQVLVSAGLTDLLGIIARLLLKPGSNAVTSQRSFIHYVTATKQAGGELIDVPMQNDGFDLRGIASAVNEKTRIVFLANPNNPTGTLFDAVATDEFLHQLPEHVTVILDEAYYDYAQYFAVERGIQYSHSVEYVRQKRNLLVLRTFSKVYGLAGVRVGYALGDPGVLKQVAEAQSTFAVSVIAQAGALTALDDHDHVQQALENNAAGMKFLFDGLFRLGFSPVPSWANFVYCDVRQDAAAFAARMEGRGVLIRPLAPWGAATAVRVTVGSAEQNQRFLQTCERVLEP